ncbi:NACHT domain-containing NTPase [Amycolatopsis sp. Hca4]|uniref:NACHT domain-containing NTPase n=1 Tax=Amycolatopsis sp. Hca4 TaxID=2742131 RepID=UPI0034CD7DAA
MHWLDQDPASGRRPLDDETDWVRRELVEAGRLGIEVVPVFLDATGRLRASDLPEALSGLERNQYVRLRHRHPADLDEIARAVSGVLTVDEDELRAYLSALAEGLESVEDWMPYATLDEGFVERRVNVHSTLPERRQEPPVGEVGWTNAARELRLGVVLADAGAGKTWLLRRHCLQLCQAGITQLDDGLPVDEVTVPVLVHSHELATAWTSSPGLDAFVTGALSGRTASPRLHAYLAGRLAAGSLNTHVLVDAYDEVFEDRLRDAVDNAFRLFIATMVPDGGPSLLVTSRPAGFLELALPQRADDGEEPVTPTYFELGTLGEAQVRLLWERWYELRGTDVPWQRLAPALTPTSPIRTAVRVPLLAAFAAWVAEDEKLRTNRSGLYRQVVDRFYRLGWKRGSPAPSPVVRQDAALRASYRAAFAELAWHMATSGGIWRDAVPLLECESVLQRSLGTASAPYSRTFEGVRTFGVLIPWGSDEAAPVGWIHRTVHQFVVAEYLLTLPGEQLEELLDTYAWFHPEWAAALDFALGMDSAPAGGVTSVVQQLCSDGEDALGWFAMVMASSAAGSRSTNPETAAADDLIGRLYRAGFLTATHLARVLALTPLADAVKTAELVHASAEEHGYGQEAWDALAWCGAPGLALLRVAVTTWDSAAGAAKALHGVAPGLAVQAMEERIANSLPVDPADRLVVRELGPTVVRALCSAHQADPGDVDAARLLGWTSADEARAALSTTLESANAGHRRSAVAGLAASFGTELDEPGFARLLSSALHDRDRDVRVAARSELVEIGISVPWVSNRLAEYSDELYRDETAPQLDSLASIAARLDFVGPSTDTAIVMLMTEPALITGPVQEALARLTGRALDGDLEPRLLLRVAQLGGRPFRDRASAQLLRKHPLPEVNRRRLAWAVCHAFSEDPGVFTTLARCARRAADPHVGQLLREHGLAAQEKVRVLLTHLLKLQRNDRTAVEIWTDALREALLSLPPVHRAVLREPCASATRHVLKLEPEPAPLPTSPPPSP